jgi:hypothetical protein
LPICKAAHSSQGQHFALTLWLYLPHTLLAQTGVFVEGAAKLPIKCVEDVLLALAQGVTRRQVSATDMNARSSRSHTILTLDISSTARDNVDGSAGSLHARLNLVDLAGSESVRLSGAEGARLREGAAINKSLLTLSRIINMRSKSTSDSTFIPFRESKLTHLLEPSLSGKAKTAVVCCLSPCGQYVEESRSTLQFATSAKSIHTNPARNEVVDDSTRIARLRKEITQLKADLEVSTQAAALRDAQSDAGSACSSSSNDHRQARLTALLQEFICGGEVPDAGDIGGAAARGRTALGMARMARKGRGRRDRDTWCPSVGASSGALAAMEAFRVQPTSPVPPSEHRPRLCSPDATSASARSSLGAQSTMSTSTHGSSSTAGTEAEENSLQLELHRVRAALAAARRDMQQQAAAAHAQAQAYESRIDAAEESQAADAADREEALEAALCRAEAAEATVAAQEGIKSRQQAAETHAAVAVKAATNAADKEIRELQARLATTEQERDATQEALQVELQAAADVRRIEAQHATQQLVRSERAAKELQAAKHALQEEQRRCARLEKVKVTQDLIDTLKNLKSDRKALRGRVGELAQQLAEAKASGSSNSHAAAGEVYLEELAALQQVVSEKEEQLGAAEAELAEAHLTVGSEQRQASRRAQELQVLQLSHSQLLQQHEALIGDVAGMVESLRGCLPGALEAHNVQMPVSAANVASTVRGVAQIVAHRLQSTATQEQKLQDATERTVRLAQAVKSAEAAAATAALQAEAALAKLSTVGVIQQALQDTQQQLDKVRHELDTVSATAKDAQAAFQANEKARAATQAQLQEAGVCLAQAETRAAAAQEALLTTQSEAHRNAEFLEKENLQLMIELRTVRREVADSGISSMGTPPSRAPLTPVQAANVHPPTAGKTANAAHSLTAAQGVGDEDAEGECKQQ